MRVKIAYTVELEEIEPEVAKIMSKATNDIDDAHQEVTRIQNELKTNTGNSDQYLESIHFARVKMAKADQILEDCYLIIQGLKQANKQQEETTNEIQDG